MIIGNFNIPRDYIYLGCANIRNICDSPYYIECKERNLDVREVKLGRCWYLYICDELKVCWDVDSSD